MTESDWHRSTDPAAMLAVLADRGVSERKLRLFAVACCRRVWHLLPEESQTAAEVAERYADGLATQDELHNAHRVALRTASGVYDAVWAASGRDVDRVYARAAVCQETAAAWFAGEEAADEAAEFTTSATRAAECCVLAVVSAVAPMAVELAFMPEAPDRKFARSAELSAQALMLKDIIGDPFRSIYCNPSWRTSTAVALARQMYESRDFGAMPILGDALEDAGCQEEDVLNHCREPGVHVCGCWVVDRLLNRA